MSHASVGEVPESGSWMGRTSSIIIRGQGTISFCTGADLIQYVQAQESCLLWAPAFITEPSQINPVMSLLYYSKLSFTLKTDEQQENANQPKKLFTQTPQDRIRNQESQKKN